jgi:hypothetical protein
MNDRITRPSLRVPRAAVADRVPMRLHKPRFMLGALESRVFAQVDGRASVHAIARIVGFAPSEVMSVLERLERVNAVRFADVLELESAELDEDARETMPDLSFDRPTMPGPSRTMGR